MIALKFERFSETLYRITDTQSVGMYWPLHFWIEEVLGKIDYSWELSFLRNDNYIAHSYNMTALTKEGEYVVVEDLFGDDDKVYIPKNKFAQLLEVLKKKTYLTTEKYRPKLVIFTFDDEWNCTITYSKT